MRSSIQRKMMVYIILFFILPLFAICFLFYNMLIDVTKDKLDRMSHEMLQQMDENVLFKISKLQNKSDIVFISRRMQELLRETDFSVMNSATFDAQKELDGLLSQYFYDEDELESIIIFSDSGGAYVYNGYLENKNTVYFTMKYGKVAGVPGEMTWFGVSENPNSINSDTKGIVAGISLSDTNYLKDGKYLATAYLVFKSSYFESVNKNENISIMISTPQGKNVFSSGENVIDYIWKISLDVGQKIYGTKQGSLRLDIDGKDCIVIFDTSPSNGWKYIRVSKYAEHFAEAEKLKNTMLLLGALLIMVMYVLNVLWVKKITAPIKDMMVAMHEVGKRNFDFTLNIHSNDEFAMIGEGFNDMVVQIKNLFAQVVREEKKSKEAEILALQYQINPHFLYNTLSAIRITALFNEQDDVANMLLILGRFLRNTISNAGKMIRIDDEIGNMKDYVSLYQIRYNHQINAEFYVEHEVKDYKINVMLIQPIIENAILHGLNQKLDNNRYAEIKISAQRAENGVLIKVRDNGVGMSKSQIEDLFNGVAVEQDSLHIGIRNIDKRIKMLFGEDYGVEVKSVEGAYAEVGIRFPVIINNIDMRKIRRVGDGSDSDCTI